MVRGDRCIYQRGFRSPNDANPACEWDNASLLITRELCVLRTFGGVDFSLVFICAQSVPEFLWDRLRASIEFHVMPKRAQYARFSGEPMNS